MKRESCVDGQYRIASRRRPGAYEASGCNFSGQLTSGRWTVLINDLFGNLHKAVAPGSAKQKRRPGGVCVVEGRDCHLAIAFQIHADGSVADGPGKGVMANRLVTEPGLDRAHGGVVVIVLRGELR